MFDVGGLRAFRGNRHWQRLEVVSQATIGRNQGFLGQTD
jgi:hypothetical protein